MRPRPYQQLVIDSMLSRDKGQLIVPTGGGKTFCMIQDAKRLIENSSEATIIIVAPRILLAQQLSAEFLEHLGEKHIHPQLNVLHVHSGDTCHYSTTKTDEIKEWINKTPSNKLIFTTYHSLHRVSDSDIEVDTIYFDEAHNSVQKNFIESVDYFSLVARRSYFFTATPKHSLTPMKAGMNDVDIFGEVLVSVKARDLIDYGAICSPKVTAHELQVCGVTNIHERDCKYLLNVLDKQAHMDRVLVTAKRTKDINNLMKHSSFFVKAIKRDYAVMHITSKYGAYINNEKVDRQTFFETLKEWGSDVNKKFICFHHSILSEGINVNGLTSCILMRNMDYISMAQTIGRVIRIDPRDRARMSSGELKAGDIPSYTKGVGLLCVPILGKVGISTHRRLQTVVDTIFEKGEPAISVVSR
tara:strand:+ start:6823 stop:8064 length:1242 start_codon:yes stop_codon:yes gene_type:complete